MGAIFLYWAFRHRLYLMGTIIPKWKWKYSARYFGRWRPLTSCQTVWCTAQFRALLCFMYGWFGANPSKQQSDNKQNNTIRTSTLYVLTLTPHTSTVSAITFRHLEPTRPCLPSAHSPYSVKLGRWLLSVEDMSWRTGCKIMVIGCGFVIIGSGRMWHDWCQHVSTCIYAMSHGLVVGSHSPTSSCI